MNVIKERLIEQGDAPWALHQKRDWKQFGDGLSKDICLSALFSQYPWLRKEVKEQGGIVQIWRNMFPRGASVATSVYGPPSHSDIDNSRPQAQWQYQAPPSYSYNNNVHPMAQWQYHQQLAMNAHHQQLSMRSNGGNGPQQPPYVNESAGCKSSVPCDGVPARTATDSPWGRLFNDGPIGRRGQRSRSRSVNLAHASRNNESPGPIRNRDVTPIAGSRRGRSPAKGSANEDSSDVSDSSDEYSSRGSTQRSKSSPVILGRDVSCDRSSPGSHAAKEEDVAAEQGLPHHVVVKNVEVTKEEDAESACPEDLASPMSPEPLLSQKRTLPEISDIWVVVGATGTGNRDNFQQQMEITCHENHWHFMPVCFPSKGLVLHSGSVVNRVVQSYDEDILRNAILNDTGAGLATDVVMHCVVHESANPILLLCSGPSRL